MILFVVIKPQLIYDHNKNEYKGFGDGDGKTIFTLPVLAIAIAVFIAIIFCNLGNSTNNETNNDKNKTEQIKYIPIPMNLPMNYYPMMQMQQPIMPNIKLPDLSSSLQFSSPLQHAFPMG